MSSSSDEEWLDEVDPDVDPEVLRRRRKYVALAIGAIIVVVVAGLIAYRSIIPRPGINQIIVIAQSTVQNRIQSLMHTSGTLWFSPKEQTTVRALNETDYEVRGWVRFVAPDGEAIEYLYSVKIRVDESGAVFRSGLQLSPLLL